MENRKEIGLDSTVMETVILMAEGNPGAVSVLGQLLQKDWGLIVILHLDDMNIRGSQIWIAYKDYCKEDIDKLKEAVIKRDPLMIAEINNIGMRGNHKHKAVTGSASYGRREFLIDELTPYLRGWE